MTLTIDLPADLEKTVRQQAARNGQEVGAFVLQAVNEKLAKAWPTEKVGVQAAAPTSIGDEFYAEGARLPETEEAFETQRAIFRNWRGDARFEVYWPLLDQMLARSFQHVRKWAEARAAIADLEGYDFDAHERQSECDRQRAGDHLP